jgi:hypothetical protein
MKHEVGMLCKRNLGYESKWSYCVCTDLVGENNFRQPDKLYGQFVDQYNHRPFSYPWHEIKHASPRELGVYQLGAMVMRVFGDKGSPRDMS